jgi:hypothetical protein
VDHKIVGVGVVVRKNDDDKKLNHHVNQIHRLKKTNLHVNKNKVILPG